jgi:hypothetical protein
LDKLWRKKDGAIRAEQKCVAVWLGGCHKRTTYHPARTGFVHDNEWLLQPILHRLRHNTTDDVGITARRIWYHESNGMIRPDLRLCGRGNDKRTQCGKQQCELLYVASSHESVPLTATYIF